MTATSKALKSLANDHLIECFRLAAQMELDADFIIQLKTEIDERQLTNLLQQSELVNSSKFAKSLNATG